MEIAIDSNALTYLVEAMDSKYDPKHDDPTLAVERISMLRIFLYTGIPFYILPQVMKESNKIPRFEWRNIHHTTVDILLMDVSIDTQDKYIQKRKTEFMQFHQKNKDCQILAEAEAMNISSILTRDSDFKNRLSSRTTIRIAYPSEFWNGLNIATGAKPISTPAKSNPLFSKYWWNI